VRANEAARPEYIRPRLVHYKLAAFRRSGPLADRVMSDVLQFIIVVVFGALCFGGGYLTAFIVTRNKWRDEMIKRGVARYNWHTGKWEWGEPPKER
jgi:hypothetical protein